MNKQLIINQLGPFGCSEAHLVSKSCCTPHEADSVNVVRRTEKQSRALRDSPPPQKHKKDLVQSLNEVMCVRGDSVTGV